MQLVSGLETGDPGASFWDMGGCQNDGPSLDPYYDTAPNIRVGHNFDNRPYDGAGHV